MELVTKEDFRISLNYYALALADPRGAPATRPLPRGPNSFIFIQFSAKYCKITPTWDKYLKILLTMFT